MISTQNSFAFPIMYPLFVYRGACQESEIGSRLWERPEDGPGPRELPRPLFFSLGYKACRGSGLSSLGSCARFLQSEAVTDNFQALSRPTIIRFRDEVAIPYRGGSRSVALTLAQRHRTVTKVKVGTICVDVLSNLRKLATPTSSVTIPMACMAVARMPPGSFSPARVPIPSPTSTAATFIAIPRPKMGQSIGFASWRCGAGAYEEKGQRPLCIIRIVVNGWVGV